jgi:uncharacterized repeat protein (TIGR03803 family)
LFGTTGSGGDNSNGVIFELRAKGRKFVYERLYSLAACDSTCVDGAGLETPLIVDTAGNLYGVAGSGGPNTGGVTFKLTPNAKPAKSKYQIIYAFCALDGVQCTDGAAPASGLSYAGASSGALYDGKAPLFGTTIRGGSSFEGGAVFSLSPGKKWSEKVVYAFCATQVTCPDGFTPEGAIVVADPKTIFGTTAFGGDSTDTNSGTIYEVNVSARTETVLHDFCTSNPCKDGTRPHLIGVTEGPGQTLLGATTTGGKTAAGVAYGFDIQSKKETPLVTFCRKPNCTDGSTPSGPPAVNGSGMVGVTQEGGVGDGVLYSIDEKGKEKVLHDFCAVDGCGDGQQPVGNLVVDKAAQYAHWLKGR